MASYWTRKDDASKELDTIKPWDEILGHGALEFPRKHYDVVCAVVQYGGMFLAVQKGSAKYDYISYKWEFPGGKVEQGEEPEAALKREMREELDMEVVVTAQLASVSYSYPDFDISLQAFLCETDSDHFVLKEHASGKWASRNALRDLPWCDADAEILNAWEHSDSTWLAHTTRIG